VEAEALATITEKNIRSFVWKKSFVGMGYPRCLSLTMESSSTTMHLGIFYSGLGIKNHYSSLLIHKLMDRLKL